MKKESAGIISIVVFVVIALIALSVVPPPANLTQKQMEHASAPVVLGTFTGMLPCADCAGLTETLTLAQTNVDTAEGTYMLTNEYAEKGTFNTQGNWTTLRGDASDENAVVYELDPDTDHPTYYLKVDENAIRQLTPDMTEIDSPFDQTLHRTTTTNTNP